MDLKEINAHEARHPWEIVRAEFVLNEVRKLLPKRVIDIGSGDGYLGQLISKKCGFDVLFIDKNFSEEQLSRPNHFKELTTIERSPGDLILLADVIEHIEDSRSFFKEIVQNFETGTPVIITVPAYMMLFSEHDSYLGHYRRYTSKTLSDEVQQVIRIINVRYFFFLPLLIRLMQVGLRMNFSTTAVTTWKYREDHLLTRIAVWILRQDVSVSFLPGLSVLLTGHVK